MDVTALPNAMMAKMREHGSLELDHIAVAVRSIAAARVLYEALGLSVSAVEEIEHEGVRTAMLAMGATRLELMEPLTENSVIGRFLDRRGEGMHHIAMRVGDVDARFAQFKADGVRLASDAIRIGAGGHRYFFIHPESAHGVLVEIVSGDEIVR